MSANILWIRRLIWAYFGLLIFEGVLRKWVVPSLAGPLLLIRDPFVIAIYILTYRAGLFPRGLVITAITAVGVLSLFAGLAVLSGSPAVALYGFQADFLHLPLIFVIPRVFDGDDVRKVGYWTLVFAIPMVLLMIAQFKSPGTAWINAGAGEGAAQIGSAEDHVRSSGTFSFVTGAATFYALTAAFLFDHLFSSRKYPMGLVIAAALSTAIAAAVAGSRTLVVGVALVIACAMFIGMFLQPRLMLASVRVLCLLVFVGLVVSQLPIFNEGLGVLSVRAQQASNSEGGTEGIFQSRILKGYTEAFDQMSDAPPLGFGLGVGTIGGATLMNGNARWTGDANWEIEWVRNVFETGPVLGLLFIALRVGLFVALGGAALRWARHGNTLPLLLYSVCAVGILNGNFGQATSVGFAVFVGGLCLAAVRGPEPSPAPVTEAPFSRHNLAAGPAI